MAAQAVALAELGYVRFQTLYVDSEGVNHVVNQTPNSWHWFYGGRQWPKWRYVMSSEVIGGGGV